MLPSLRITYIIMLTVLHIHAKKPPGYVEPPKIPDPNPPKYQYEYNIADNKGSGQGKQEQRDGIYALGRYYVQNKDASQDVQYFADDWGYHPVVEYSSAGPHSHTRTKFALGEEAVQQLKNKENNRPQLQGIAEKSDKFGQGIIPLETRQPQVFLEQPHQPLLHQQQPVLVQQEQPQELQNVPEQQQFLESFEAQQQIPAEQVILIQTKPQLQNVLQQQETETEQEQLVTVGHSQSISQQQKQISENPAIQQQIAAEQAVIIQPDQRPQNILLQQQVTKETEVGQQQQQQLVTVGQLQNVPQQQQQLLQSPETQQIAVEQVILLRPEQRSQNVLQQQLAKEIKTEQQQQLIAGEPLQGVPQQQQIFTHSEKQQSEQSVDSQEETIIEQKQIQLTEREQELPQSTPEQIFDRHIPKVQNRIFIKSKIESQQKSAAEEQEKQSLQVLFRPEESNQKVIYPHELVFQQQGVLNQQLVLQPLAVQNTPVANQQYPSEFPYGTHLFETAALYESDNSKLVNAEQNANNFANFGAKMNTKPVKLIESTKNLVSGEDVLKINEAVSQSQEANVTAITDYIIQHLHTTGYLTTASPPTLGSLNEQPIVAAELEENHAVSTAETILFRNESEKQYVTTTANNADSLPSKIYEISPTTVVVTPRPVSTKFLAPITAGIRLQNVEQRVDQLQNTDKQNLQIDVQKSVPFYLGKFEYPSAYGEQDVTINKTKAEIRAAEDIELGKTLLIFPGQEASNIEFSQSFSGNNNHIRVQQLPSSVIKEKFAEVEDQQQAQGLQHLVTVPQTEYGVPNQVTQRPQEVTKVIHKPYPVKVPYGIPYPVVKQVQIPVTVEKVVEKPIHITKYVEKPVAIPQPYPVEKIVEKPIHVPVQVTKYIDRPYPVEVRVHYPQPYPIEKVVQKIVKQPYPVEVRVPVHVEKIIEKKIPVPHYIEKPVPVEKIIEKPVPHYVDRPYPVEVKVPVPQPYLVKVEVPKPYPVEASKFTQKPYGPPVQVQEVQIYHVPQALKYPQIAQVPLLYGQSVYSNNKQEQNAQQSQQQTYFYANPYAYAPQINHYLPPKQEIVVNNGYLPSKQIDTEYLPVKTEDCHHQKTSANLGNFYYNVKPDNYIGLLPPKASSSHIKNLRKFRTARSNFDDKSIRLEYGFLPPLIPSLEIDEQGNPIDKSEK